MYFPLTKVEIGKEPSRKFQNRWPQDESFRQEMTGFFQTCHNLHLNVMDSIGLGLGLGDGFFEPYCNGMDHNLRLLHYPKVNQIKTR
jgi:isopenicillin N synthase-like dioxygenase